MTLKKYFKYQFHIFVTLETEGATLLYAISLKDKYYYYLGSYEDYKISEYDGFLDSRIKRGADRLIMTLRRDKRPMPRITALERELISRYPRVLFNPPKRQFKLSNPFKTMFKAIKYDTTRDIDFTTVFA